MFWYLTSSFTTSPQCVCSHVVVCRVPWPANAPLCCTQSAAIAYRAAGRLQPTSNFFSRRASTRVGLASTLAAAFPRGASCCWACWAEVARFGWPEPKHRGQTLAWAPRRPTKTREWVCRSRRTQPIRSQCTAVIGRNGNAHCAARYCVIQSSRIGCVRHFQYHRDVPVGPVPAPLADASAPQSGPQAPPQ